MERLGWPDGERIRYDFRFAPGQGERFPKLASEIVSLRPDVIVAVTTGAAKAVRNATSSIPTVFQAADPMDAGLVTNLAKPGGNLTGIGVHANDLMGKRVAILKEAFPAVMNVAWLGLDEDSSARRMRAAAAALQLKSTEVRLDQFPSLARAIEAGSQADAWFVDDYAPFLEQQSQVVTLINAQRKPSIYYHDSFVRSGGLMSYSVDFKEVTSRLAALADRVLRGAKPADLPVEEPTKFVLAINERTARSLGFRIANSVMLRAEITS